MFIIDARIQLLLSHIQYRAQLLVLQQIQCWVMLPDPSVHCCPNKKTTTQNCANCENIKRMSYRLSLQHTQLTVLNIKLSTRSLSLAKWEKMSSLVKTTAFKYQNTVHDDQLQSLIENKGFRRSENKNVFYLALQECFIQSDQNLLSTRFMLTNAAS